jgi:nucleoid-associated protein YgaU
MAPLALKLLLGLGLSGVVVGGAYVTGILDPILPKPAPLALMAPDATGMPKPEEALRDSPVVQPDAPRAEAPAEPAVVTPGFDILRVEPSGDAVIAGQAEPDATVEIVSGEAVIATVKAGPGGDFAAVLDEPLTPGDHQLALRAKGKAEKPVASVETAIIVIPEKPDGEVLALVEEPGAPSKLITVQPDAKPEAKPVEIAAAPAAPVAETVTRELPQIPVVEATPPVADTPAQVTEQPVTEQPVAEQPVAEERTPQQPEAETEPAKPTELAAVDVQQPEPVIAPSVVAPVTVTIEAVEIEGDRLFVAGSGPKGAIVRVYANDVFIGQTKVSDGGRFLIDTIRPLAVGSYVIRADVLGGSGTQVIARAAVPFEREAGTNLAAVVAPAPTLTLDGPPAIRLPDPVQGAENPQSLFPALNNDLALTPPTIVVEATGPSLQTVDGSVIIRRGDNLWRISRRVYGRGVRFSTIYEANSDQIKDPDRIWPGQVFSVPRETPEGEVADMEAIEPDEG